MPKILSDPTADRLVHLLKSTDLGGRGDYANLSKRVVFVRCDSNTAVGGNDILDQCYPSTRLLPYSRNVVPPDEHDAQLLLTVMGDDGESVKPRVGGVYLCILAGEVESDRSGSGSNIVSGRVRAFGVPVAEVASDGSCTGCGWLAGMGLTRCLRVSVNGTATALYLTTSDGLTWTSSDLLTICEVDYTVTVTRNAGGVPQLTLTETGSGAAVHTGQWNCCGCAFAKWGFNLQEICPDEEDTGDPCTNVVEVRVDSAVCPPVATSCCPDDDTPRYLKLTLTGSTPALQARYNGTYLLAYDALTTLWCHVMTGMGEHLYLYCPAGSWQFGSRNSETCGGGSSPILTGNAGGSQTVTCSPFHVAGTADVATGPLAGTGTVTYDIVPY